jgi:GNAT superfamily N-acetyltransferase
MKIVDEITSWKSSEEHWHSLLEEGKKCFAAKYRGQIVASMWIALDQCDTEWGKFVLKDNEAYLFSLCTKEEYRGRQIASYLRYRSYAALKEMGRDRFYSYSSFFNASSIKFKKRLNARFLKLGLYIELFKKYHWNISMRHYL